MCDSGPTFVAKIKRLLGPEAITVTSDLEVVPMWVIRPATQTLAAVRRKFATVLARSDGCGECGTPLFDRRVDLIHHATREPPYRCRIAQCTRPHLRRRPLKDDDAADVLSRVHVLVALGDLVEAVGVGDQLVELEVPGPV